MTTRPPGRRARHAPESKPEAPSSTHKEAPLSRYHERRDFTRTPEPKGVTLSPAPQYRYVIQKHWASRLHYDLRLELDGTMKSWAVPKGPSLDPCQKRLAVQVEDHPVEYNEFEGQIPAGQYGSGRVIIWDRGTWSPVAESDPLAGLRKGNFKFRLHGLKLQGTWALVRLANSQEKSNWLLIKEKDEAARPSGEFDVTEAQPDSVAEEIPERILAKVAKVSKEASRTKQALPPDTIAPQLATLVNAPPADWSSWIWELKFDGYRLLVRIASGQVQLFTRNGLDWSARMPNLVRALATLPVENAWLDGEVILPDSSGVPSFSALQAAFEAHRSDELVLYLFDLLYLDGVDWRGRPLKQRRTELASVLSGTSSRSIRLSSSFDAPPLSLLESARRMGMEGIMGKRIESPYAGGRSNDWIKLKARQSDELLIIGFTEGKGARDATGDIGALLLAAHDDSGTLRYAGKVGSGFSGLSLTMLKKRLVPLRQEHSPLKKQERLSDIVQWVRPELVAQVTHVGMTPLGRLRQPVYLGLRDDKAPADVQLPGSTPSSETSMTPKLRQPSSHLTENSVFSGQKISHPERVVDETTGITKLDLARYYAKVAPLILPHLAKRPVALLRAPGGIKKDTFFQKHADSNQLPGVTILNANLDPGHSGLLEIDDAAALMSTVQMNAVEFHTWNATHDRMEKPDRFTLDLDPGKGVTWTQVQDGARLVRALLSELELEAFLKTSGGSGLHIVVPIKRLYPWDTVKTFSKNVTEHLAMVLSDRFVALSGPKNRIGKIYVDYLRNGRGATTACAWTARARPGMGVSVPISWDELSEITSSSHWHLGNIESRLRVGDAPWKGYDQAAKAIGAAQRRLNAAK